MKTIYIDVLFTINLAVNYLLLLATARLSGVVLQRKRLLFGACVGALYAVFIFFPQFDFLYTMAFKLIFAMSVSAVAFGIHDLRRLVRLTLIFYAASFAFAGCMIAIYYMLGAQDGILNVRNGVMYANVSLGVLLAAILVIYLLLCVVMRFTARNACAAQKIVEIQISSFGRNSKVRALVDTGNALCDPMTNQPVVIVEYAHIRSVFPEELSRVLDIAGLQDASVALEKLANRNMAQGFRLVPYKAVGVDYGMLLAFRPDGAQVAGKKAERLLIALTPTRLSENASYCAVIGA